MWNRFFPGLIDAIRAVGTGAFFDTSDNYSTAGSTVYRVRFSLKYRFAGDSQVLDLRNSFRVLEAAPPQVFKPDGVPVNRSHWDRYHYGMHYGDPYNNAHFRFDFDQYGHHVHAPWVVGHSIPSQDVVPDPTNMDPREFVELVKKFRKDKQCPVRKK